MRRVLSSFLTAAVVLGLSGTLRADDWSRKWGVGILAQEATPVGDNTVSDQGGANPGTGFMLRYGLNRRWGVEGSYEYINVARGGRYHSHLVSASAVHSWCSWSPWRPFLEGGVGAAQTISLRTAAGVEYFWRPRLSARFQGAFYYLPDAGGTPSRQTAYVAAPGILITYFFGSKY